MCESSVWLRHPDGRAEKIADDVLIVRQEGPVVILRALLAEPRRVVGTIQEIDSLKHTITLLAVESPDDGEPMTLASARAGRGET
jgi:predicted RNA-binding protein